MNKKIILCLVFTSFLFVNSSLAQTSTSTDCINGSTSTDCVKTTVAPKLRKGEAEINALAAKFQNFINKMQDNSVKMGNIINEQKNVGVDTSISAAKLAIAEAKILDAQKSLDSLKTTLTKLIGVKGAKKTFASIKVKAMKTEITKIKDAHKALIETMQAIKGTLNNATSTNQASSSTVQ